MTTPTAYLYQEIAESIRRRIVAGELEAGDRLPPVRELATQWACTPGTVSRAYGLLAEEGLVVSHRGSGTHVAPNALQSGDATWHWAQLINRAEQFLLSGLAQSHSPSEIQAALSVAVSRWQVYQGGDPKSFHPQEVTPRENTLRFVGSHDLVIDLLGRLLAEHEPAYQMTVDFRGSLGGLMALARDECDIAGTHLWDAASDTYNVPFVRRILPGRRVALLTLVHRSLGLLVPAGNPHGVQGIADLAAPGASFANRQLGSGTRVWLDSQLQALGIAVDRVPGYERELTTHVAVARAVAEGSATAGIAIRSAAVAFDLDFVPLARERYELACTRMKWEGNAMQAVRDLIHSGAFVEAVAALGGYETEATGKVRWV
jgi:molybdate-binding protein/DNA-binding transcriptional regulator YhcF (GntR family)